MGAGRKTKTIPLKEKSQPPWTLNCSAPARNLQKGDLGAVIFGCKHNTFKECMSKQLFGLPAPHYSYVKNIRPGLLLFLFNYSDRQLHGIFEAESHGQMNINPYAWTEEGTQLTPYPAQVQVRIQRHCPPVPEEQFKPIIAQNYYETRLFWFELDKAQTKQLINLFSSLPTLAHAPTLPSAATATWNTISGSTTTPPTNLGYAYVKDQGPGDRSNQLGKINVLTSLAENLCSQKTDVKLMKWSSLFQSHSTLDAPNKDDTLTGEAKSVCPSLISKVSFENREGPLEDSSESHSVGQGVAEDYQSLCTASDTEETDIADDVLGDLIDAIENDGIETIQSFPSDSVPEECKEPLPGTSSTAANMESLVSKVMFPSDSVPEEYREPLPGISSAESDMESLVSKLVEEIEALKVFQMKQNQKIISLENELVQSRLELRQLRSDHNTSEVRSSYSSGTNEHLEYFAQQIASPVANESILIVGGSNGSWWLSELSSYSPSHDCIKPLSSMRVVRSYASAAKLSDEIYIFGGVRGKLWYDTVDSYNPISNQWTIRPSLNQRKGSLAGITLCDKIFAVGGGDGDACFSDVEMLDLSLGRWISAPAMHQKRFSPAAAEINGALYVVGGYDGRDYLKSAERFDPREYAWTSLYSLGGYDGKGMVSTVEVYDPRAGSWLMEQPMKVTRGYTGAVALGEKIYVIGGMNDKGEVLNSIECYEDSQGWQVTNLKAVGKRCFFSALVL